MATLLVIDMQNSFIFRHDQFPRYGSTIDAVKEEIMAAMKRKDFIIFVEFCVTSRSKEKFNKYPSRVSPTLSELTNLTINYLNKIFVFSNNISFRFLLNKIFVYKSACDGGAEVLSALKHFQIPKKNIRVCGVYTNACVRETVRTIAGTLENSTLNVVGKATTSSGGDDWQHNNGLELLKQMSDNIVVI